MPLDVPKMIVEDEVLLQAYARGDRKAAQILAHRLTPKLLGHAYRILGDQAEAEDVAQEAMLRLWKIAPKWEAGRAQVSTWLYRVVANLCTDRLRKRRVSIDVDDAPEIADESPGAEEVMGQKSRMAALKSALDELPERQRQAVILRHIEGLNNPEIAQIMDLSVEAVESLTARGKRALKTVLAPQKDELGYSNG